jgi:hypothetical protein
VLAWIEAGILTIYGLVLTTAGLFVQAGIVSAASKADHRALAWHAYLWDPWFLAWGAPRRCRFTMRTASVQPVAAPVSRARDQTDSK